MSAIQQVLLAYGGSGSTTFASDFVTAYAAWGVRKMVRGYSGQAIRVRRSSDNAETDIGFVGKDLDVSTLLSHVGAGDGFVKTIYDQSGNGKDFGQSTSAYQPKIVSAGSYLGYVQGDGTSTYMTASSFGSGTNQVVSLFGRYAIPDPASGAQAYFLDCGYYGSAGVNGWAVVNDNRPGGPSKGVSLNSSASTTYNTSGYYPAGVNSVSKISALINSGSTAGDALFVNGSGRTLSGTDNHLGSQFTFSSNTLYLGKYATGFYSAFKHESLVVVEADAMSARTNVEAAL